MNTIFISHSSRNSEVADELKRWLESEGHPSIFLDFDPQQGIPPGRRWERELYANLDACGAVIALASVHFMTSRWCFHEVASARARGIPVLPLQLDDAEPNELLVDLQMVDIRRGEEEWRRRVRRGLLQAGLDPTDSFSWDREKNQERGPYPGLAPFRAEDAGIYFGRDGSIRDVRTELQKQRAQGASRAVLILGASGSGKSSLMHAGVLPRLSREAKHWIVLEPFEPLGVLGPLPRLARSFARAFDALGAPVELRRVMADLTAAARASPPDVRVLNGLAEELTLFADQPDASVLLTIDQAEQLLHAEPGSDGDAFLVMLRTALEQRHSPLVLLATMRSDQLKAWQEHPALVGMRFGAVTVGPPPPEAFRHVIELPARAHGLEIEIGFADTVIADVGLNADALPLLAFTLRELYEREAREKRRLDIADYRDRIGGIARSLERKAEELFPDDPEPELEAQLRATFLALARPAANGAYVSRPLDWNDVPDAVRPTIEALIDVHLLISSSRVETGDRVITVAHEALFRVWPRLANWLLESRRIHEAAERVRSARERWQAEGTPPDLLLRAGRELEEGRELLSSDDLSVNDVRAFIEASIAADDARQREAEAQRQRERDARKEAAWQREVAERQRIYRLCTQAVREVQEGDGTLGLLLALEAAAAPSANARLAATVEAALLRALFSQRERRILDGGTSINRATFSPDGRLVLTAGQDGRACLWDAASGRLLAELADAEGQLFTAVFGTSGDRLVVAASTGQAILYHLTTPSGPADRVDGADAVSGIEVARGPLLHHDDAIYEAAFAPGADRLVTASADGTARLWSGSGALLHTFAGHLGEVTCCAFVGDERVLTASSDGTARLWDATSGACVVRFEGHGDAVYRAVVSADGKRILTASWDRTARLWQTETGTCTAVLEHDAGVEAVAFAPSGDRVATTSADGLVRLWDPATGHLLTTLVGHFGQVFDAGFAPDGSRLASVADDGTVRLWDLATSTPIATLNGHAGSVWQQAFAPDGGLLVSASDDGTARLWDMAVDAPSVVLRGHSGDVYLAGFAPDGSSVATCSADGTARVFDARSGDLLACLDDHEGEVWDFAFTPGGTHLVTASADGRALVFELATGQCRRRLEGHEGWVGSVAIAPSGRLAATAGEDGTARLWSLDDGGEVVRKSGHAAFIRQVVFLGDERIATASDDGTARLWSLSGDEMLVLEGSGAAMVALAPSPDGRLVAVASIDHTVHVFDTATGAPTQTFRGHKNQVWHTAFSPRGRRLISASHDHRALIFDPWSGDVIASLVGHRGRVVRGGFCPTGRFALTASWDRTAKVWHAASGQCIATLSGHAGLLYAATFSPDGRRVLTASSDGTAALYDLPVGPEDDWVAHARRILPRQLTDDERWLHL